MRSLGFLSLFALAACAAPGSGVSADPPGGVAAVAGRTWIAQGAGEMEAAQRPRLEFQRDGRLAGYTGCNSLGGAWRESDGAVKLSGLAVTKRFCVGPAGELEKRFLAAVNDRSRIEVIGGELVVTGASGERLAFSAAR